MAKSLRELFQELNTYDHVDEICDEPFYQIGQYPAEEIATEYINYYNAEEAVEKWHFCWVLEMMAFETKLNLIAGALDAPVGERTKFQQRLIAQRCVLSLLVDDKDRGKISEKACLVYFLGCGWEYFRDLFEEDFETKPEALEPSLRTLVKIIQDFAEREK